MLFGSANKEISIRVDGRYEEEECGMSERRVMSEKVEKKRGKDVAKAGRAAKRMAKKGKKVEEGGSEDSALSELEDEAEGADGVDTQRLSD